MNIMKTQLVALSPSYLGLQKMIEGIATVELKKVHEPEITYSGIMRFETGEEIEKSFTQQHILDCMRSTRTPMHLWENHTHELCELFVFRQFFKDNLTHALINKANEQFN